MNYYQSFLLILLILLHPVLAFQPLHVLANTSKDDTSVSILPGPLTLTYQSNTIVMNNHKDNVITGRIGKLMITDATGSASGWHVNVKASPVIEKQISGIETILPSGSLQLHKQDAKIKSNGGTFPQFFTGNYISLDNGRANTILTAYPPNGMGQYEITFPNNSLRLLVPQYKQGNTYSTTFTFSVIQGP